MYPPNIRTSESCGPLQLPSPNPASQTTGVTNLPQPATGTDGSMMAHYEFGMVSRTSVPRLELQLEPAPRRHGLGPGKFNPTPNRQHHLAFLPAVPMQNGPAKRVPVPHTRFDTLGLVSLCEHDQHHSPEIFGSGFRFSSPADGFCTK